MTRSAGVVICGAGIAGVAAAYFLSKAGRRDILLVDDAAPLSLTSNRSTECYRNWWPDAAMVGLMNRSIDLMEALALDSGNAFQMNRRGYLYLTGDEERAAALAQNAQRTSDLGAGPIRTHVSAAASTYPPHRAEGFESQPDGADLLLGPEIIRAHFPAITERARAALHVRRAGWFSAQQMGMRLREEARERGVQLEVARVEAADVRNGRVHAVRLSSGEDVGCEIFVNAAGPWINDVNKLLGLELPIYSELHLKAAIRDSLGVVPRDAPLMIWEDAQKLDWSESERGALAADDDTRWMTESLPAGAHTRPEGGGDSQTILMLWEYRQRKLEPTWPPPSDQAFAEIALRGLAAILPRMRDYFDRIPRPQVDGGYYTRTRENRPLIGPTEIEGAFVLGALSGFGIMAACGAAELLAQHITGAALPLHASAFLPARYDDAEYLAKLAEGIDSGQL